MVHKLYISYPCTIKCIAGSFLPQNYQNRDPFLEPQNPLKNNSLLSSSSKEFAISIKQNHTDDNFSYAY